MLTKQEPEQQDKEVEDTDMKHTLLQGDCLERMKEIPDNSVDSIVTDPPYGLSFMGKKWDYDVPSVEVWAECLRVLKPGGHLLAFAGTRTQHRMAVRIEDAGFEIRDMIAWVYGSGFPKSLDVSKAIDKAAGIEREVVGKREVWGRGVDRFPDIGQEVAVNGNASVDITAPATPAAQQWQGWGTALKPALEPITVARKPLGEKTVAANVLAHGAGAINVDGCRVGTEQLPAMTAGQSKIGTFERGVMVTPERTVRWPANLIHDGSEEVVGLFPVTTSGKPMKKMHTDSGRNVASGASKGGQYFHDGYGDTGSAARFFYCAKASKKDRDEGCEGMEERDRADQSAWVRKCNVCGDTFCDPQTSRPHCGHDDFSFVSPSPRRNHHPTVKPTALMRYLCRLVTPPEGIVLDPFMGSGSTGKAAMLEDFRFIGIERDPEYYKIAEARIKAVEPKLI
jgi:site-specific DNA-methyltransferase (adenine-specific)